MIAEYDAVKARLEAQAALAGKVSESARRNPTTGALLREQYVILFGGPPDELGDERLASPQAATSDAVYIYPTRTVSVTAEGARLTFQKVMGQLVGCVLVVAGRRCYPMHMVEKTPSVEVDLTVTPPLYFINASFVLKSDRA
ncbi:MAG: hypothetical protein JWP85_2133 [Rhodoglobus sp.]|nr:hypothetical protein [Rhodoglobus sp.]